MAGRLDDLIEMTPLRRSLIGITERKIVENLTRRRSRLDCPVAPGAVGIAIDNAVAGYVSFGHIPHVSFLKERLLSTQRRPFGPAPLRCSRRVAMSQA